MKLSSLLLGGLADLFQDSRIDDVETSAKRASRTASRTRSTITGLAQTVEKRIRDVERENAMLSMLIVGILKHLTQSHPEETQKIVDEVAAVLRSGAPTSSDLLRQMLDLPAQPRTPSDVHTKPAIIGPRPPQRQMPVDSPKKPQL